MRRWLAIFMLTLLPLQFSWAAVTVYCGHETGHQARHLGHHDHEHAAQSGAVKDGAAAEPGTPLGFDLDCGHCHGACASMPAPAGELAPPTPASHPVAPGAGILRTLAQSPPERPQWATLA